MNEPHVHQTRPDGEGCDKCWSREAHMASLAARVESLEAALRKLLWSQAQHGYLPIEVRKQARAALEEGKQ